MTTLLWTLAIAAFLPLVWGISGGALRAQAPEGFDNNLPRRQAATLTGLGERFYGAQANAWEALAIYTACVVIAQFAGADPAAAGVTGMVFIGARVLHGVAYAMDLATLRSLLWFVGIGACIRLLVLAAQA
ncbi:MAG: MAPEG family protein [Pseudomonadota bacterium]